MIQWRRVWIRKPMGQRRSWQLMWYDDNGRLKALAVGPDKRRAEAARRQFETDLNNGKAIATGRMTLDAYTEEHLEEIKGHVEPATLKEHKEALASLRSFIGGDVRLDRMTDGTAKKWFKGRLTAVRTLKDGREKPLSTATANKQLRTLKAIFAGAEGKYMAVNPFSDIGKEREVVRNPRIISRSRFEAVMAEASPMWRAFLYLAVTTGLREADLCHLRWSDLDFDRMVVNARCRQEHDTKNKKEHTAVLVRDAIPLLQAISPEDPADYIFRTRTGGRFKNNLLRTFRSLLDKAGIDERYTLHDLRRSFGSAVATAGGNSFDIRDALGHSSTKPAEYYLHRDVERLRELVEKATKSFGIMSKSCHKPFTLVDAKTA